MKIMTTGVCPSCKKALPRVNGGSTTIQVGMSTYDGFAYSCPSCNAVISVEIDPIAMKNDIVESLLQRLRK